MFSHRLCDSSVVFWPRTCCDVALEWVYELHKQRDSVTARRSPWTIASLSLQLNIWIGKTENFGAAPCGSANAAARGDGRWGRCRLLKAVSLHRVTRNICKSTGTLQKLWPRLPPPLPGDELCPKDKLQRWISIIVNLLRSFRGSGGVFEARDSSRLSLHQWSWKT